MRARAAVGLLCAAQLASAGAATPDCAEPSFQGSGEILEAPRMAQSADPCWWLSSGAVVSLDRGLARTVQGELPAGSEWHQRYAASNPVDTDGGAHPQNLLRLVTRASYRDVRQEVRFRILKVNLSPSSERGEWSGVLQLLRYQDADTLYYAGVRMDGTAVIKKKLAGRYATLAQRSVYGDAESWDRSAHPSLLPAGRWIGLASEIRTAGDGAVHIALYTREDRARDWRLAVEAVDAGADGAPILAPGHGGLRADFMDVEFGGYVARPAAAN